MQAATWGWPITVQETREKLVAKPNRYLWPHPVQEVRQFHPTNKGEAQRIRDVTYNNRVHLLSNFSTALQLANDSAEGGKLLANHSAGGGACQKTGLLGGNTCAFTDWRLDGLPEGVSVHTPPLSCTLYSVHIQRCKTHLSSASLQLCDTGYISSAVELNSLQQAFTCTSPELLEDGQRREKGGGL